MRVPNARTNLPNPLALVTLAAANAKRKQHRVPAERSAIEHSPVVWLATLFPETFQTFAPHHVHFWQWIWSIERGTRPQPYVAIWPRGGGKSTNAEVACVALGARHARSYGLYVCATQEQADDHVQNVGSHLESVAVETYYPALAQRAVSKYGTSKGWRRNRLRTASGFTLDAVGLDTAARGLKIENDRPDFIVFDDLDTEFDSPETTRKKIDRLTKAILPAGSHDAAVLGIQNLVLPNGIFAQLAGLTDQPVPFLSDRILSGPIPAAHDFTYEEIAGVPYVRGGTPTWDGLGLDEIQALVLRIGITSFLVECQHEVAERADTIVKAEWFTGRNRYDAHNRVLAREIVRRYLSFDTAEEVHEDAAYTVCLVGEMTHDDLLLIRHVERRRMLIPALPDFVTEMAEAWNFDGKLLAGDIVIEYKSSGKFTYQHLYAAAPDWIKPLLVKATPIKDKSVRLRAGSTWMRNGSVKLPLPHPDVPWLPAYEAELYAAPNGKYMDQADTTSQLIHHLRSDLARGHEARLKRLGLVAA